MPRCILVIEAGPDAVLCGAFPPTRGTEPQVFTYSTGDLKEALPMLRRDLESKGIKPAKVLLSIHSSLISMRIVDIPIKDRRKLKKTIIVHSGGLFLKDTDKMLVDALPLSNNRAAFVAIEKDAFARQLQAFKESGMEPCWAGPGMLSKPMLLNRIDRGQSGIAALVDDDSITAVKDGQPLFFKHLGSKEDLVLSLAALDEDGVRIERFYSTGSTGHAQQAGIDATDIGSEYPHASLLAVALHHGRGMADSVDFLKMYADPDAGEKRRVQLRTATGLAAALVIAWGLYSYLKYLNLDAGYRTAASRLETGYSSLFPGERAADPEYGLEVKLKELSNDKALLADRADVLTAMIELSRAAGSTSGVRVNELQAFGPKITVVSEARSFEEAAEFRTSVEKGGLLKNVALTGSKPLPDGRVTFSLSAETGALQ